MDDAANGSQRAGKPGGSDEPKYPSVELVDSQVKPAAFYSQESEGPLEDPYYEVETGDADGVEFPGPGPVLHLGGPTHHGYAGGDYFNDPISDGGYPCRPDYFPIGDRLWFRGEYLLWWTRGSHVPPLVTTSPNGTARADAGVLGLSTTSILFGDTAITDGTRSGGRMTLGYWLRPSRCVGLEVGYLGLGSEATRFQAASLGDPILARPFLNVQTGQQDADLIAFTNVVDGSVRVDATTELQAVEVLLRRAYFQQGDHRLDFLLGYRFGRLDDSLRISESTVARDPGGSSPVGTTFDLFDLFDTENKFHGVELGVVLQQRRLRWSLEVLMKLGLGNTHTTVVIDGSTTTTIPGGGTSTGAGGILALPTNIGTFEENAFSVVPELGVTLSYDLTCRLQATLGYSLLYWSAVGRPGDQIDLHVNPSQFPPPTLTGSPEPVFSFRSTDFWAQGLNFGLEYRF